MPASNNKAKKTKSKTKPKKNLKDFFTSNNNRNTKIIALVACVLVVLIIFVVAINANTSPTYTISVADATDETCNNEKPKNECSGTLVLDANLSEDGMIPSYSVIAYSTGEKDITETTRNDNGEQVLAIPSVVIVGDEYANVMASDQYGRKSDMVLTIKNSKGDVVTEYKLSVFYNLSDKDKQILNKLEQERQAKIAEEERKKAEEQAAAEAEAARKKAEAEAAAAVEAAKKTPFTYTSSKCGYQGDVYCLLLSDFVADGIWKDRIKATFSDFISKTSAVSSKKHLIYIFQNAGCYQDKISSKGLSVCEIPGGEIAVSEDTKGITWSYEQ